MENTINATLHNLVDYATDKFFSNDTVEQAKDKYKALTKSDSNTSNILLYSGLALAAAGAAYLIYKNREAIKEQFSGLVDHVNDLKSNIERASEETRSV